MVTFTHTQINDALDRINNYIAIKMIENIEINLFDESNGRQYTLDDLRDRGWSDYDLIRLMWADPRTPWPILIAFQDEKNRLNKEYYPLSALADGPHSKFVRLVEFFEHLLDAYNSKDTAEMAP